MIKGEDDAGCHDLELKTRGAVAAAAGSGKHGEKGFVRLVAKKVGGGKQSTLVESCVSVQGNRDGRDKRGKENVGDGESHKSFAEY